VWIKKFSLFFLLLSVILLFASCGAKKTTVPRYRFEVGNMMQYKLKGLINISLDAGLLKYDGTIDFTADMQFIAVETNEKGYKIQMDIRNPDVKGANGQIMSTFYIGLNYVRTWLGTFYLSDTGKTTVYYNNQPVLGLNSYAQILFPDFTDLEGVWKGMSESTNFPAKLQKQDYTMTFSRDWGIRNMSGDDYNLYQKIKFLTFNKEDFDKSVDPASVGTVTLDQSDVFDTLKGRLRQKNGKLQFNFNLPLNQGLFSYIIAIQGNGEFELIYDNKPL